MNITLSGESTSVASDTVLQVLIDQQQPTPPFAIAVNEQFITRDRYDSVVLKDSDSVEIVSPMSGG